MDNLSFIFISSKPWYSSLGGTAKSLAFELGKQYRTYYINVPLDRKTLFKNRKDPLVQQHLKQLKTQNLLHVANNLYQYYPEKILESANWIPLTTVFKRLTYLNNKWFSSELNRLIKKEQLKNIVLINDKDIFRGYYLKELVKPTLYIYLDRDYVLGVPYWAKHGKRMEPDLMKKSDLVLCNSQLFTETALKYNEHSFFVGNGCDITLFNGRQEFSLPYELQSIPRPFIGYAGALVAHRLDINLLEKVVSENKGCSFILIGSEDEAFKKSKLHREPNVYFTGPKSAASLPAYYAAMDVCINPQLVNSITEGNYPMKIDEYLAMGKPVVAMKTHAMQYFSKFCYLADSPHSFSKYIPLAISENTPEKAKERMKFASEHSWPNFTKNVLELINNRIKELS